VVQELDFAGPDPALSPESPDRSIVVTLADGVDFNDVLTTYISRLVGTKGFSRFALFVYLDSTAAPTDIRIQPVFTSGRQDPYFEYRQGPFAALFYEDADTAAGLADVLTGDVAGDFLGVRIVATGTTSSARFRATVRLQLFK